MSNQSKVWLVRMCSNSRLIIYVHMEKYNEIYIIITLHNVIQVGLSCCYWFKVKKNQ